MTESKHRNRLAGSDSPYLLAHADNPVDWYPWSEEAFAKAKAEDKPIFLSIGYNACHWCHVMARESFADEQVAAFLNRHFVSIKVDREERPDIDHIHMQAVIALTGSGGWPMSVFLTPDKRPFFAGTHFPPRSVPGRPGFLHVITELAAAYRESRGEIESSAREITENLASGARHTTPPRPIDRRVIEAAAQVFHASFDHRFGGFGPAPKFPQATALSFLFRASQVTGDGRYTEAALITLDKMAQGGIHDQLGGGFHRYAVDPMWLTPHFEKMLYDNALLVTPYLEAFQITGERRFLEVAGGVLGYLRHEMAAPEGAFYSSRDADSGGEEGRYYLWTRREIENCLGNDADWFCRYYGVTADGNVGGGTNILHRGDHSPEAMRSTGLSETAFGERLDRAKAILLEKRRERPAPSIDDKILSSWNGLAVSAFAQAYQVTGDDEYLTTARRAADFILHRITDGGALFHSWRNGSLLHVELLEDYAFVIAGLIDLYQASFEESYLAAARRLTDRALSLFRDRDVFYSSPQGADDLIIRPRDLTDGATPSPGSVMIANLQRLAAITGDRTLAEAAQKSLTAVSGLAVRLPQGEATLLMAGCFALTAPVEIALVGGARPDLAPLRRAIHARFIPNKIVVGSLDRRHSELPLLKGRLTAETPACFVCRDGTCRLPVTDPALLENELAAALRR